jgi:hypothetical protein
MRRTVGARPTRRGGRGVPGTVRRGCVRRGTLDAHATVRVAPRVVRTASVLAEAMRAIPQVCWQCFELGRALVAR